MLLFVAIDCHPNKCQPASDTLAQTLMEKNKQIMRLYRIFRLVAIWLASYIGTISKVCVTVPG